MWLCEINNNTGCVQFLNYEFYDNFIARHRLQRVIVARCNAPWLAVRAESALCCKLVARMLCGLTTTTSAQYILQQQQKYMSYITTITLQVISNSNNGARSCRRQISYLCADYLLSRRYYSKTFHKFNSIPHLNGSQIKINLLF
ncbi:uncharacterized protein LOC128922326 isoform X2 [Zeugodacus cucurbitae]|uniref:uncharacterized protein LOC128922326 isoform X2 n=1 Tax=Zeugodacus cucurbitae TaxID=28588 RepID=UPI0023D95667|nr:uncharacterized protein LOC128922326 isoform X2 [Zeugodacus cucurbitae]